MANSFPGLTRAQVNALIEAYAAPLSHQHAASAVTSGQMALARGGTGADLSATGGSNQFLKQVSGGAVVTVGAILSAELTSALTTPPAIGGTTPAALTGTTITGTSATINSTGAGALVTTLTDSGTNNILDLIRANRNSSGTPADGYGANIAFRLKSSTTNTTSVADLTWYWDTATHASRNGGVSLAVYRGNTTQEAFRAAASTSGVKTAVNGATPVARQAHIADPSGGGTQDAEARTAINAILNALENFGILLTS